MGTYPHWIVSSLETMSRVIYNIDGKVIFNSPGDQMFINFVKRLAIENEDEERVIDNLDEALYYLDTYCPNLELVNK